MSEAFIPTLNDANPGSAFSASFTTDPFDPADLDPSLVRAAALELVIAPALAHSKYASARAYVGTPTSNLDLIAAAAAQNRECNWTLNVGASGVVVLEIDTRIGYAPLSVLCRNSFGRWTKTLQFRDDVSRFLLFRGAGRRVRFLGQRYRGLKIHTGNAFIFIPPSWFVSDRLGSSRRLVYINPNAPLVDAPDWIWEPEFNSGGSQDSVDVPGRISPSALPAPWEAPESILS
ncbi:MAG: bifunctional DNA primase/polymerase [Acidobacteriota bacterium]